ncbi:MAG: entericidin A/B family lipoprotein [Herbaspirillum sp.]
MKRRSLIILLVTSGYLLTACNTFNGFGKDVEKAGEKIQSTSKNAQGK